MSRMRAAIKEAAQAPAQVSGLLGEQRFCFDRDFIGFSGHFPGNPILPGVLQVLLAQLLVEEVVGVSLPILSLTQAKFQQQLHPGDLIDVRVNCREKDEIWHCKSELLIGGQPASSFTLQLGKGSGE